MPVTFQHKILFIAVACALLLCSCKNNSRVTKTNIDTSLTKIPAKQDTTLPNKGSDDSSGDYAEYYLTIADSGTNYYGLDKEMYMLHNITHLRIDTMNRHYDKIKKEIVVSENDDDELYRGEYYPRRDNGVYLSIEHLNAYTDYTGRRVTALVAAMCDTKETADSVLSIIRTYCPGAYVYKQRVYVGCMH